MTEFLKSVYLKHIKYVYKTKTMRIRQKKYSVLFITTFEDNNTTIKNALSPHIFTVNEIFPEELTIKEQMRMIKQADTIIVDNYYYPLAALNLKNKLVIQIWHAPGAIKKFGLASPKYQNMPESAKKRYRAVYNSFNRIVVGSDAMKDCMKEAFGIDNDEVFVKSGFPRSDYLYNQEFEQKLNRVLMHNEYISEKYTILYMPTFRDNKQDNRKQIEYIERLANELPEDFRLLYHLHPSVLKYNKRDIENAIHVNGDELIGLYKMSNLIITDYSSVAFESAVFETPCAFFIYDYEEYQKHQGLFVQKEEMPGYVTEDIDELINYIINKNYVKTGIRDFDHKWNEYNSSSSGRQLVIDLFYRKGE